MKIKVIVNPRSKNGDNKYLKMMLKEKFGQYLVDIEQTAYPRHATEIAQRAVKENVDTIVAVGGDGTVNEVLNSIVGTEVALGIIPTGTANDLASLCHIPKDLPQACEVIFERHLHCADVICVNGWYYVTAGGLGLPCEVVSIANTIKRQGTIGKLLRQILGSKVYILAVLCALFKKARRRTLLNIRCNGSSLVVDSLSLMVNNQPFLGKNFLMSPAAINDDGMFDICLIENFKRRMQILSILIKVITGRHIYSPSVKTWRAKELIVNAEEPLSFIGDGEIIQQGTQFSIQIIPRALRLLTPIQKGSL